MDRAYATIRLGVAYVVGTLLTWMMETFGVIPEDALSEALVDAVTVAVSIGYYLVVRVASVKWPLLEWLLGVPKSPVYVSPENLAVAKRNIQSQR